MALSNELGLRDGEMWIETMDMGDEIGFVVMIPIDESGVCNARFG